MFGQLWKLLARRSDLVGLVVVVSPTSHAALWRNCCNPFSSHATAMYRPAVPEGTLVLHDAETQNPEVLFPPALGDLPRHVG